MATAGRLEERFGRYGGRYVPETLMPALDELIEAWQEARNDASFHEEIARLAKDYVGRPTPVYEAERLTEAAGGARIFLKREDLAHTAPRLANSVAVLPVGREAAPEIDLAGLAA